MNSQPQKSGSVPRAGTIRNDERPDNPIPAKPVCIIIAGGQRFLLYADGKIEGPTWAPSPKWVCTGAVMLNGRRQIVRRFSLEEVIQGIKWKTKTGRQRARLADVKDGEVRIWMQPDQPDHEVVRYVDPGCAREMLQ
jgi:hypothetical protein